MITSIKVLVVDDEQDIVELIAYNFVQEGFDALRTYDSGQALTLVRAEAPDPVILNPAIIYLKWVIPAEAGIQEMTGFRVKPGMTTFEMFTRRSNHFRLK